MRPDRSGLARANVSSNEEEIMSKSTTTPQVIPDDYSDLLDSTALAHVATVGPHGEPQTTPVWFGWDGEFLQSRACYELSERLNRGSSDSS